MPATERSQRPDLESRLVHRILVESFFVKLVKDNRSNFFIVPFPAVVNEATLSALSSHLNNPNCDKYSTSFYHMRFKKRKERGSEGASIFTESDEEIGDTEQECIALDSCTNIHSLGFDIENDYIHIDVESNKANFLRSVTVKNLFNSSVAVHQ